MAAPFTPTQIIKIAKVSQYLAGDDVAKGVLYGPRLIPTSDRILYMERKAVEWMNNLDPTNSTLRLTSNYLYSICRGYNLKAQNIVANGSSGNVTPITPTGSGYKFTSLPDTISVDSSTYTNSDLVGGKDLGVIVINDQSFQAVKGDFTFNPTTGTVTFLTISLFTGDSITLLFNQKI